MSKVIEPAISKTAFSCPHCLAYTTQDWHSVYSDPIPDEQKVPFLPTDDFPRNILERKIDQHVRERWLQWFKNMQVGTPFFNEDEARRCSSEVSNLFISECYNCHKLAIWIHDRLLYPNKKVGVTPNADLPAEICADFEEAREIVNYSPRGSAALLRLCVQKLCSHLGEKGQSIDDDIASLVAKGLNPLVQKSLDIVRVIGNEAVHPGVIDLKDDRETALNLFLIVNTIADQMISHPKSIHEMYNKLPEAKRNAIDVRNSRVVNKPQ